MESCSEKEDSRRNRAETLGGGLNSCARGRRILTVSCPHVSEVSHPGGSPSDPFCKDVGGEGALGVGVVAVVLSHTVFAFAEVRVQDDSTVHSGG